MQLKDKNRKKINLQRTTLAVIFFFMMSACLNPTLAETTKSTQSSGNSESILYWNKILYAIVYELNRFDRQQAPLNSGDNPPRTTRAMAMMHMAIREAVKGIKTDNQRDDARQQVPESISIDAAIMGASYTILKGLFGDQGTQLHFYHQNMQPRLNSARQTFFVRLLRRAQIKEAITRKSIKNGIDYGKNIGRKILNRRMDDGSQQRGSFNEFQSGLGQYRMDTWTPDAQTLASEPQWGNVDPFMIKNAKSYKLDGPPPLGSKEWQNALREVEKLGKRKRYKNISNQDHPKADEKIKQQYKTAYFWSQKGLTPGGKKNELGTITPAGQWLQVADDLVQQRSMDIRRSSQLYSQLTSAMADATIAAWYIKYKYEFWRPVQAIRWAEIPINKAVKWNFKNKYIPWQPKKIIQLINALNGKNWIPLIPTSMHPEYVSGHSAISGAAATILEHYFVGSEKINFTVSGDDAVQNEKRTFKSFRQAAQQAGRSRIYGGIHFGFSSQDGLKLGRKVANDILDQKTP